MKSSAKPTFMLHPMLFVTFVGMAYGVYVTRIKEKTDAGGYQATPEEKAFKNTYLIPYMLAMLADWLQGPYVYALYAAYGFSKADNGLLFIFGFGPFGGTWTCVWAHFVASVLGVQWKAKAATKVALEYASHRRSAD